MSDERKNLLDEANALGLGFKSNIPTEKLKAIIEESKSTAIETHEVITDEAINIAPVAVRPAVSKKLSMRQRISDAKKRAYKTRIVTLTNKDNRENDVMTTAYLSFENQHFGLSKVVPLDMPVELENALIQIAAATTMTLHKDEIIDGRRTGNKLPVIVKKFAISYGKPIE